MKQEQEFLTEYCLICCGEKDKHKNRLRKFVTHADNINKLICTNCGFTKKRK